MATVRRHNTRYAIIAIDDREREVANIFEQYHDEMISANIRAITARLANGDYTIGITCASDKADETDDDLVLRLFEWRVEKVIIERKTYADFAQSIIDHRIENIERMRALAPTLTNILLIEGSAPTEKICGVTPRAIRAKSNHLMVRDGIHVIESASTTDTVARLIDLARDTLSLFAHESLLALHEGSSRDVARPSTIPVEHTTEDFAIRAICALPGIGKKRASQIVRDIRVSVASILSNPANQTSRITQQVVAKIASMSEDDRNRMWHDIILAVPLVSPTLCAKICAKFTISDIAREESEIATLLRENGIARNSDAIARNIHNVLHYVYSESDGAR